VCLSSSRPYVPPSASPFVAPVLLWGHHPCARRRWSSGGGGGGTHVRWTHRCAQRASAQCPQHSHRRHKHVPQGPRKAHSLSLGRPPHPRQVLSRSLWQVHSLTTSWERFPSASRSPHGRSPWRMRTPTPRSPCGLCDWRSQHEPAQTAGAAPFQPFPPPTPPHPRVLQSLPACTARFLLLHTPRSPLAPARRCGAETRDAGLPGVREGARAATVKQNMETLRCISMWWGCFVARPPPAVLQARAGWR
jgi:hypothetical protein